MRIHDLYDCTIKYLLTRVFTRFIIISNQPTVWLYISEKKVNRVLTMSLLVFKLVNNSNEYHKSLFRVLFPFVHRPSYLESQTNCFELQKSPKDIYCVVFLVCSALKVKSLNTKAKFWFFSLMFYFANSSSNTRRALESLNLPYSSSLNNRQP